MNTFEMPMKRDERFVWEMNKKEETLFDEFRFFFKEIIDAVKEKLIKMVHSRDGARVAIHCLWYGANKVSRSNIEMKKIIKKTQFFRIENY